MWRRGRIVPVLAVVGLLFVVAGPGARPAPATGAPLHRAAVVVDTGTMVKRVCVRFSEDSISGMEALDRAGVDPVYRPFGGSLGSAVCSLCGVGRDYDSCLGGGGSASHWAYWRATDGATSYAWSPFGVSTTRVRDGDVEAWRWGTGGAPPFASVVEVCGTEVSPTPAVVPPAPTTAPAPSSARPSPRVAPASQPATTTATVPSDAAPATATTSIAPGAQADDAPRPRALAARSRTSDADDGGGSGPGRSLLAFVAAMAGLVGLTVRARRRRRVRPG